jgi:RimJ/RimL family protein N-acetyltransferase
MTWMAISCASGWSRTSRWRNLDATPESRRWQATSNRSGDATLRPLRCGDAGALALAASESRAQYDYTRVSDGLEDARTWLAASAQRTRCNTEAFYVWQVYRVALKTDERNAKSRRAIERLGAFFEGVRRADMPG